MIRVFRCQRLCRAAVDVHSIQMGEVGIPSCLFTNSLEEQRTIAGVDMKELRDVAVAGCDLAFELASLQIIEIQLPPVVALGEPDHFIGGWQVSPVDASVS